LSDGGRIYSLAPAQRRFNAETVAFFNATCGPTVYRGDLLGEAYTGHVFVCEPLTSVVHHRRLDPNGPTYTARRVEAEKDREFLASSHPWFRPVNLATGPDGALYVLDFCRAWVEHPAFVPEKQRNSVDFREGFKNGRIWRVVPKGLKDRPKPCRPGTLDTARLVALLEHPNGWCRDTAQRLLVERKDANAAAPLRALAAGSKDARARVHALWTLQNLGAADAAVLKLRLADPHPRVREAAVRAAVAGGLTAPLGESALAGLADDPDARVRLRAAEALGLFRGDQAREALGRIAARDAESPWTSAAVLASVGPDPGQFLERLAASQPVWLTASSPAQAEFLARLAARIGAGGQLEAHLSAIAAVVVAGNASRGAPAAFALLQGWADGRNMQPDLDQMPEALRREVAAVLARAAKSAADPAAPAWIRLRALAALLATRDPAAKSVVPALLAADQPAEVQAAAALGLARLGDPALADDLLARWDGLAVSTRRVLLGVLCESPALTGRLVTAVEKNVVAVSELDPATRLALRRTTDPALKRRVSEALGPEPGADRRAVVGSYEKALNLSGDPARGRLAFEKHCKTCHSRGGQGAKVGPELLSIAGKAPADLLVAILDPSREAAPDGVAVLVATTRGETLTGLLVEENPTGLRLRRAEGVEELVPRAEVEAVRSTGRSLMPDGLEQVLSPQDLADLIAFLRSP
ncbi:MAG: c-type cytochrome, partial [Isosphaeraceae bacterium]